MDFSSKRITAVESILPVAAPSVNESSSVMKGSAPNSSSWPPKFDSSIDYTISLDGNRARFISREAALNIEQFLVELSSNKCTHIP